MYHLAGLLALCFVSVYLLELPDKTSLVVITLAPRGAFQVWLGASAALVLQAALAVGAGVMLTRIAGIWIHWVEVLSFLGFGAWLWRTAHEDENDEVDGRPKKGAAWLAAFLLVFVAEFGDLTQLSMVAWAARIPVPWAVFVVASLALTLAALTSATAGHWLARRVSYVRIKQAGAVLFLAVGTLILAGAI